jgi:hypothetical protein
MSPLVEHPDLVGLLRGELANAQVTGVADHLDTCTECRDELSQVAIGHALLSGASRTLSDRTPHLPLAQPAPLDRDLFRREKQARWQRPALMLAAAAVLVAGTAGIATQLARPEPAPPVAGPTRTVELLPVEGNGRGQVQMADASGDAVEMTIDTEDLPTLPDGEFYYAWLLDPETNKMLPLGQIGPGGTATFELPVDLISKYSAIDVSLEYDDGDPEHSITSVLRAEYT